VLNRVAFARECPAYRERLANRWRERLRYHLFALAPQRFSGNRVERISANTLANGGNHDIVGDHFADVAILAVASANGFGGRDYRGPY
jgi:hypothetical protein